MLTMAHSPSCNSFVPHCIQSGAHSCHPHASKALHVPKLYNTPPPFDPHCCLHILLRDSTAPGRCLHASCKDPGTPPPTGALLGDTMPDSAPLHQMHICTLFHQPPLRLRNGKHLPTLNLQCLNIRSLASCLSVGY
jgi:hypothetical protein